MLINRTDFTHQDPPDSTNMLLKEAERMRVQAA